MHTLTPIDPNILPGDAPRATSQNAVILARLRSGPATNRELADISLKYTGRISDLRQRGHAITAHRMAGGLTVYVLAEEEEAGGAMP